MDPNLDALACRWQWALDAAAKALDANPDVAAQRAGRLGHERQDVAALLRSVATMHHVPPPWLAPGPVTPHQLALPDGTQACLFDLDGVLTDSAALHAAAWGEALDAVLLELAHETDRQFVPFDRGNEYRSYLDGRPRLEGIALFFSARGIELSRGRAVELARRKGELVVHGLEHRGVAALPGARRYLQAVGHARLGRAVISASATTVPMLQLARIEQEFEVRIDAETIRENELRSRPAPDVVLDACRRLGVDPSRAVTLTHSADGMTAGKDAGTTVIGVGIDGGVLSLSALLDPRLAAV